MTAAGLGRLVGDVGGTVHFVNVVVPVDASAARDIILSPGFSARGSR
jgi:hypothetical protein